MKNIVFSVAFILMLAATGFSQNIPQLVTTAFQQKFPDATSLKWSKENAHEYEAEFQLKGMNYSANFSDAGAWLETESTITFNQLPAAVQTAFNTAHKDAKVKAVAKIENAKGVTSFEVEIKRIILNKEIMYDDAGNETKE
jgi:hypothetical protein